MNNTFLDMRDKYSEFIYDSYNVNEDSHCYKLQYKFVIPKLCEFNPTIEIEKDYLKNNNINKEFLNLLVFHLGLVELISYYKSVCSKKIIIKCGYLDEEQKNWWKKLYYNGLGEFFYTNNIRINLDELCEIEVMGEKTDTKILYKGEGNLIPIGGGKDSCVSLELLKELNNTAIIINPKEVTLNVAKIAGYENNTIKIYRKIDENLMELNNKGYLNGHTPFSALVAFLTYLCAYLSNKKYIVLSNEASANEPTVPGTNINHQYSKTYEFEKDFYTYTKKYFKIDIKYFSLLRPIKEIQIAYLFSKYKDYHKVFRSCNVGSKSNPWKWCLNCPKCLFVFIILRTFLPINEMIDIFGENLLDKKELEKEFLELIGESLTKPFECIGTIDEVKYAMNRIIKDDSSYLSNLYKEKYLEDINIDLSKIYYEHNVEDEYLNILKEAIKDAR
jgi:hypothetical protein